MEEATEQEPGRKSASSSSSLSSSESSAESPRHVDVVELGDTLLPAPEDEQFAVASSIQSAEGKPDGSATVGDEQADPTVQGAGGKQDDCATLEDEHAAAPEHSAEVKPDDRALPEDEQAAAPAVRGAEVKPDDWAAWPEPPPPAVEYSCSSDGSAGAAPTGLTEAPQVQTMAKLGGVGAGTGEFDPQRIPASVFQTRASMSQAEWSMTSNESLFSIQGASDVGGPYAGSRSHFDFFYDEAMAAAEAESKLPSVAEGMESAEFAAPGSASSRASGGSANAKKATVFRRHDSGSGGSSSNFSFAFPILAPTSPKKKELVGSALFQPLEKEYDQQPPELEPPGRSYVYLSCCKISEKPLFYTVRADTGVQWT
ncbi:mucin-7-like [Panicum miliaceum]|uniref:Mucin-7-like n=1 Tax=Panicum miliaceum TaxID=4540 RepID=A0A3L6QX02_PANMI|nr:mucin-7-like [Panicum miliaceum]